ncbi:hypothetical protein ACQP1O_29025 [Nocardia sp. CA-151230]|uniref:hypothetical protein n=1 Tax=Nocardia sp. CA-151230 TaxID=3239982 RepID=UPI003D8A932D
MTTIVTDSPAVRAAATRLGTPSPARTARDFGDPLRARGDRALGALGPMASLIVDIALDLIGGRAG